MTDGGCREILIKNIPYEIDENALRQWCSDFGPVVECTLKLDRFGKSRGFAFVTFETEEGHDNILSHQPHFCHNRRLQVKSIHDQVNSKEFMSQAPLDYQWETQWNASTNNNLTSTSLDNAPFADQIDDSRLVSLQEELEANVECMRIAHDHEIKLLNEQLIRERKLLADAKESYKEAEENLQTTRQENARLRKSVIQNVMQTYNMRRCLARQTKEQLRRSERIDQQSKNIQSN